MAQVKEKDHKVLDKIELDNKLSINVLIEDSKSETKYDLIMDDATNQFKYELRNTQQKDFEGGDECGSGSTTSSQKVCIKEDPHNNISEGKLKV